MSFNTLHSCILVHFRPNIVYFWLFIFRCSTRYSAVSQIIFLDKQSETCPKKFLLCKIFALIIRPYITNMSFNTLHSCILCHLRPSIVYFRLFIFRCSTRCSAGSQIIFLDKQSETCAKKLHPSRNLYSHKKIKNLTKT